MKKWIRKILLVVCIVVFCFSAYQLFSIYMKYKKVDDANKALHKNVVVEVDDELNVDFAKLKEMNADTIAWFDVENYDASYVIMQSEDNDFYLRRNFDKEYSFAGTLFMDYLNHSDFSDFNTILYGHNMRNGSMFGWLKNYKNQEFYNEHPYIDIYIEGKKLRYQVFSVKQVAVASTNTYYIEQGSDELKQAMIDEWMNTSLYSTGVEVGVDDKILTLSTCVESLDDNYRWVVNAKLIETSDFTFE